MSAWRGLPPVGGSVVTDELTSDLAEREENDGFDEQDDLAAYRRARVRARTRRLATGAAGLLGLAIIWQIVAMLANSIFLPSVTQTIQTFAHYIDRPYPSQGSPLWLDAVVSFAASCSDSPSAPPRASRSAPRCPRAA